MKIISFEGIEGVGKSTQIKMLDAYLKKNGFSTEVLREPGSTIVGEKIRDILLNSNDELSSEAELLLMFSARAQLIKEKIINSTNDFIYSIDFMMHHLHTRATGEAFH
jgi:dTMP kinase